MNFLKSIKLRGAIHETLLPLIFGEFLDDTEYWYEVDYDLPRLARDVLLFYFGLTQSYCFALAQYKNVSLEELDVSDEVKLPILKMWDVDDNDGFDSSGDIFSYFINCANSNEPDLFTNDTRNLLIKIHKAYASLASQDSRAMFDTLEREEFLKFLESLPLLRHTEFNQKNMKFEMCVSYAKIDIKASPFVTFLSFDNGPIGEPVETVTFDRYILYSVSKGDANNELFFDTIRLDEMGVETDKRKLSRQIQSNENLTLLCKTANIKTQWYSVDECWCDLKFLNKMVDATERVLLDCCRITDKEYQNEYNIREDFVRIFKGTELYETVLSYSVIKVAELNGILFGLFLTEGLFKTVRCIIHNPSVQMFDRYIEVLIDVGVIDEHKAVEIRNACARKIASAIDKLSHIVSRNSDIYRRRSTEIHSEWKTFYVLQAAGIKSENLFADVETILSIDDYYDMIENTESTIENDLIQLLETLCVFYSALIENTVPFDEEKYYSDAERIALQYVSAGNTLEALFDSFIDIAEKCEKLPQMEQMLGRKGLGRNAVRYLKFCKEQILSEMKSPSVGKIPQNSNGYQIFVSYSHEDYATVKPIVERWKEIGLRIFFDESDIHHGQDWQKIAEAAMDRDECKLVVAFFSKKSVCKEAVSMEIEHAHLWRSRKYPQDEKKQGMFIIPINLENEPIKNYLPTIANVHEDINGSRAFAKKIYKCVSGEDVFIDYTTTPPDELDMSIVKDYEMLAINDGRVVAPYMLDRFKLAVANFYAFLKYGTTSAKGAEEIDKYFNDESQEFSGCIFPIVASVKEARIKRDNIAIVGYELIRGKGRKKSRLSHILTSRTLEIYDYYCIPKYRNPQELRDWMVEPLLIRCDRFIEILAKAKEKNNG